MHSTVGIVGAALIALTAFVQPAAAEGPAEAPGAVPLSMRETSAACIPQEELRKIAERRCEQLDATITNVKFIELCGARGHAPMYSTIVFDCKPSRALH